MSGFDERGDAFEKKAAHDAELRFKAEARRNKLLGHWAAEIMGITGDDAEAYAKSVVVADLEEAGDDDVYRKVAGDLEAKGHATDEVRAKMTELMATAQQQVMDEAG